MVFIFAASSSITILVIFSTLVSGKPFHEVFALEQLTAQRSTVLLLLLLLSLSMLSTLSQSSSTNKQSINAREMLAEAIFLNSRKRFKNEFPRGLFVANELSEQSVAGTLFTTSWSRVEDSSGKKEGKRVAESGVRSYVCTNPTIVPKKSQHSSTFNQ